MRFLLGLLVLLFMWTSSYCIEVSYEFGRGLKIDNFTLGGYTVWTYEKNTNTDYRLFNWEELAFIGFWDITESAKLFIEIDSKNLYTDPKKKNKKDFKINRLYFDYAFNDYLKARVGRFITPIGYWNPIYIIVLQWTTSRPITSTTFFPMLITGVRFYGYIPKTDDTWQYDLFTQIADDISDMNMNIQTKEFYGFQLKRSFWENSYFGITGGYWKHKFRNEILKFVGFNFQLKYKNFELTQEYFYAKDYDYYIDLSYTITSYYIQGVIKLFPKNYLVGRIEHYEDFSEGKIIENTIVGWNYRPAYPVSLKVEYKRSFNKFNITNKADHFVIASFSFLF